MGVGIAGFRVHQAVPESARVGAIFGTVLEASGQSRALSERLLSRARAATKTTKKGLPPSSVEHLELHVEVVVRVEDPAAGV